MPFCRRSSPHADRELRCTLARLIEIASCGQKKKGPRFLLAQAECCDQGLVPRRFSPAQVAQQSATLANQLHQPAL
jgi:hypothetical protein